MSEEARRLFRVRKTINEMLRDRNFTLDREEKQLTEQSFIERFSDPPDRDKMTMLVANPDKAEDQMMVFFSQEAKLGIKSIRNYEDQMTHMTPKVNHAIVVVQNNCTPACRQTIEQMRQQGEITIEIFMETELLVNITQHVLVPEHQVLQDEEKEALLKKYKLKPSQLPRMQQTDPVAKYYGLKTGQVVKIKRPSETAGRYVTYRLIK
eukprot:g76100.t1